MNHRIKKLKMNYNFSRYFGKHYNIWNKNLHAKLILFSFPNDSWGMVKQHIHKTTTMISHYFHSPLKTTYAPHKPSPCLSWDNICTSSWDFTKYHHCMNRAYVRLLVTINMISNNHKFVARNELEKQMKR
jgi:hypothetical protein